MKWRDILTIGSFIIAIVSLAAAIYFYTQSIKEREPVYFVSKSPTLIYDGDHSSQKLKMSLNDSVSITNNIYVASYILWNEGKETIDKSSVRSKLRVEAPENVTIYDWKITKQFPENHPHNFSLSDSIGNLYLDWQFFDHRYGLEFQVIYASNSEGKAPELQGEVIGKNVREVDFNPFKHYSDQYWYLNILVIIWNVCALLYLLILILNLNRFKLIEEKPSWLEFIHDNSIVIRSVLAVILIISITLTVFIVDF